MNTIRDELVAAGWTLLRGFSDSSGNHMYLQTASYQTPDGNEVGQTVLYLFNPSGTSHVEIRMWERWNSSTQSPQGLSVPATENRRLSYSHQTSLFYWLYANEFWFFLVPADSAGNFNTGLWNHGSSAGVALPPSGIPVAPNYKPIFVLSAYNPAGNAESGNASNFISSGIQSSGNYFFLNPYSGTVIRTNFLNFQYPRTYIAHPDTPVVILPFAYLTDSVNNVFAVLPYAAINNLQYAKPVLMTFTVGSETWLSLAPGSVGHMFVRIA